MLTVSPVTEVTDEVVEALARLVPQLSRSSPPPSADDLATLVATPGTILFAAVEEPAPAETDAASLGRIVGTLTLVTFRIPTGVRAWIEDVVVDESVRGQGGGEALTHAALAAAAQMGATTVDLTSRPSRQAANRLYQRMGFVARETNVYRYNLD